MNKFFCVEVHAWSDDTKDDGIWVAANEKVYKVSSGEKAVKNVIEKIMRKLTQNNPFNYEYTISEDGKEIIWFDKYKTKYGYTFRATEVVRKDDGTWDFKYDPNRDKLGSDLDVHALSLVLDARQLLPADIDDIYDLCKRNETFYQYHPPFVTMESIINDMNAVPADKTDCAKFYVGYFRDDLLVAIMDLVLAYPTDDTAYIGFFMVRPSHQNMGVGSRIISECADYLRSLGYLKIRLGVDKDNPQSNAFWQKNGFVPVGENEYIVMELNL